MPVKTKKKKKVSRKDRKQSASSSTDKKKEGTEQFRDDIRVSLQEMKEGKVFDSMESLREIRLELAADDNEC